MNKNETRSLFQNTVENISRLEHDVKNIQEGDGDKYVQGIENCAQTIYKLLQRFGFSNITENYMEGDLDKVFERANGMLNDHEDYNSDIVNNHIKLELAILLIEDEDLEPNVKKGLLFSSTLFNPRSFANPRNSIPLTKEKLYLCSIHERILKKVSHYTKDRRKYIRDWAKEQMMEYSEAMYIVSRKHVLTGYNYEEPELIDLDNLNEYYFELSDQNRELYNYQNHLENCYRKFIAKKLSTGYFARVISEGLEDSIGYTSSESIVRLKIVKRIIDMLQRDRSSRNKEILSKVAEITLRNSLAKINRR